jgi:hypothetical protein
MICQGFPVSCKNCVSVGYDKLLFHGRYVNFDFINYTPHVSGRCGTVKSSPCKTGVMTGDTFWYLKACLDSAIMPDAFKQEWQPLNSLSAVSVLSEEVRTLDKTKLAKLSESLKYVILVQRTSGVYLFSRSTTLGIKFHLSDRKVNSAYIREPVTSRNCRAK